MRSKTINLLESIQQNSITNVIDKVAEQFKSEIIEEYKASETKEMSTELENKITKALALEGVDSPKDWVADVCSVALDMTPTGEALAIKEDENTDIKGQLKQLGIKSIYVSDEHKRADEDELNKLGGLEYNYRLQRNPSKAHYYSYLSIKHETLGDIYISFDVETNKIDTTGFPWNFIEKAMTPEIKEFVETNEEFFNNLLKSKELGTGINLNESAILDNKVQESEKKEIEDGDYVWFKGVDNEEDLGKAYVDMVGMEGISDKSKYIDEEEYRNSWREAAEESIREENPDLDEDEFEAEVEKWLDAVVPEQLEIAKLDGENLDKYFDYEALGRDLNFEDYYFVDDGCIGIFN